jgi:hypothetical protein
MVINRWYVPRLIITKNSCRSYKTNRNAVNNLIMTDSRRQSQHRGILAVTEETSVDA